MFSTLYYKMYGSDIYANNRYTYTWQMARLLIYYIKSSLAFGYFSGERKRNPFYLVFCFSPTDWHLQIPSSSPVIYTWVQQQQTKENFLVAHVITICINYIPLFSFFISSYTQTSARCDRENLSAHKRSIYGVRRYSSL